MNLETTNESRIESLEVAFWEALRAKDYDSANQVIDFLADAKEYAKGLELCVARCKAIMKDRMTLPKDYGEKELFNRDGTIKVRPIEGRALNTDKLMKSIIWGEKQDWVW